MKNDPTQPKWSKVVAIDGPSGSGKSTVAKLLGQKLGFSYIDTGAMYRAVGLYFDEHQINCDDTSSVINSLQSLKFEYGKSDQSLVCIDDKNYTPHLRQHRVSELASRVSKMAEVRDFLVSIQQSLPNSKGHVMEGRDIGTVVFPRAFCKIFLTASKTERANRRFKDLKASGHTGLTFDELVQDIEKRDHRDSTRGHSPLIKASDAIEFDTTGIALTRVVDELTSLALEQALLKNVEIKVKS